MVSWSCFGGVWLCSAVSRSWWCTGHVLVVLRSCGCTGYVLMGFPSCFFDGVLVMFGLVVLP